MATECLGLMCTAAEAEEVRKPCELCTHWSTQSRAVISQDLTSTQAGGSHPESGGAFFMKSGLDLWVRLLKQARVLRTRRLFCRIRSIGYTTSS